MTEELEPIRVSNLADRSREEIEETALRWFDIATDMKGVQDQLVEDLESALNLVRRYQAILVEMGVPDPGLVEARRLLIKYKMPYEPPKNSGAKVYADGVDITEHPDSVPSTADDMALADSADTMEIVEVDGKLRFRFLQKGENE